MSTSPEIIRLFYELWEGSLPGRAYLLATDPLDSFDRLPRSEAADVHRALRYLNRLGHLIARGVLDGEFASSLVGKDVIRTLTRLKPALDEARARRADPQYLEFLESLLEVCRDAYPDYEPQYYEGERRGLGVAT